MQRSSGVAGDVDNLEAMWNPKLFVENALGDIEPSSTLKVQRDSDGYAFIVEKKTIEDAFSETMELGSFPFDVQV